jgi:hypothetical protein
MWQWYELLVGLLFLVLDGIASSYKNLQEAFALHEN